jgi:hypothetical protein
MNYNVITMIEILFDSLTVNSLGLSLLSLGLCITHFWKKRKLSRDRHIVVIDGIKESVVFKFYKVKLLVAGVILLICAISLLMFNYSQRASDFYVQLVDDTYEQIIKSESYTPASRDALREMERKVPLSFLSDFISLEIENWNSSENNLAAINQGKPICIKFYEIYQKSEDMKMVNSLERIYGNFYKSYYGESRYRRIKATRALMVSESD